MSGRMLVRQNTKTARTWASDYVPDDPEDQENVLLQFGRVGKDVFNMDYQWPLSPLQVCSSAVAWWGWRRVPCGCEGRQLTTCAWVCGCYRRVLGACL